jgi:hypothetical protein
MIRLGTGRGLGWVASGLKQFAVRTALMARSKESWHGFLEQKDAARHSRNQTHRTEGNRDKGDLGSLR